MHFAERMEINFCSLIRSESLPPPLGGRWRVAPDEGYLGQNAAILRPHQSPAVTASPGRGKPSCGKLISVRHSRAAGKVIAEEGCSRPLAQRLCGGIPHVQDFLSPPVQTAVLSAAGFYNLCTESSCGSGCRPAKRPERGQPICGRLE